MPRLKQIEVVTSTGPGPVAGQISIIALDEGGTLLWRGFFSRNAKGEETITWRQIDEATG